MESPTSAFLRGANSAASSSAAPVPGTNDVLASIAKVNVNDLAAIADDLRTTPSAVMPIVDQLLSAGMIARTNDLLSLSAAGSRAMRFASVAKI